MAWRIEVGDQARKQLAGLGSVASARIIDFLRIRVAASSDPRSLGHALKGGRFGDYWRYRVGDYRVIVSIEDRALRILVVEVGHRREIYR